MYCRSKLRQNRHYRYAISPSFEAIHSVYHQLIHFSVMIQNAPNTAMAMLSEYVEVLTNLLSSHATDQDANYCPLSPPSTELSTKESCHFLLQPGPRRAMPLPPLSSCIKITHKM